MERIIINTGIERFVLLDAISEITDNNIQGSVMFDNLQPYLALESFAQFGAMHVRWLHNFDKHAVLLKINNVKFQNVGNINGEYCIDGRLEAKSARAFFYKMQALYNRQVMISGEIMIALIDYDNKFKKEILKKHYTKLFQCLEKK